MTLPCGEKVHTNRGAGQGELEGPLKAALTIGDAVAKTKEDMLSEGVRGMVDKWFIDDGQLFLHPMTVDPFLRALDKHLADAGATRGSLSNGNDIKSSARLFCALGQLQEFSGWDTDYVRDTCKVLAPTASVKVWGAMMGDENVHRDFFDRMVSKVSSLHESIDSTSDPAVELTLKRKCADVSKAVYTLRANGDRIPMATLTSYDDMLRASLGRTLGGEVGEDSWEQAATGIFCGGLRFRRASDVALPAFIASYYLLASSEVFFCKTFTMQAW